MQQRRGRQQSSHSHFPTSLQGLNTASRTVQDSIPLQGPCEKGIVLQGTFQALEPPLSIQAALWLGRAELHRAQQGTFSTCPCEAEDRSPPQCGAPGRPWPGLLILLGIQLCLPWQAQPGGDMTLRATSGGPGHLWA